MIFAVKKLNVLTCIALSTILVACSPPDKHQELANKQLPNEQPNSSTLDEKFDERQKKSYAVGAQFGSYAFEYIKNEAEFFKPLDETTILQGFTDAIRKSSQIDNKTTGLILSKMKRQAKQSKIEKVTKTLVADNLAYLTSNAAKDGVITTASGLQYEIITPATGDKATLQDVVTVNYQGKLIDGTVFDSSYNNQKPAVFLVTKVIKGWTEGLQLMSVGSKFRLTIPQELAYGKRNINNGMIPAYSTLVFDVELLRIEKPNVK